MRIKSAPSVSQPYPRYAACASVKDYGARGDGTADDAPAIQKAADSVAAGCTIFFPPGTYSLRTSVTIGKDLIFQLAPQTTLVFESSSAQIVPDTSGSRSLTVQGEGPGTSVLRSTAFATYFEPFGSSASRRFKELRLRNIEVRHDRGDYALNLLAPTDLYEITSCLLASGYYVSLHQNAENIANSASIADTEIRPHVNWTVFSPSVLIRGLRVTGSGPWTSGITFRRPAFSTGVTNVTIQDVTFDSVDTRGLEDGYGLQFELGAPNAGNIRALIQSVQNFRGTRLLRADFMYSGVLEVTLISATFRRSSANYSPAVLNDQGGSAQIHFRVVGCSFTHDGAQNAFDAVSKSLAAASSFVEVGSYQRGWSGI
jgi:hypothetical protein